MTLILSGTDGLSDVDGSAATPAIRGTDANTGVYFPAADRLGFSTGGIQRGEFDASGNFKFNSGFGSVGTAYACRAWVNFNGTGTIAIRGSGNVTSITDGGVGIYTVNFTNSMPDVNFAANITLQGGNAYIATINARATSSVSMYSWTTASAFYDAPDVCVSIFR